MTDLNLNLITDIKKFFDVYSILSAEGKATFEAQMGPTLAKSDQNTRGLYQTLLNAAKDGISTDDAIEMMKKASVKNSKSNKPGQDQNKP